MSLRRTFLRVTSIAKGHDPKRQSTEKVMRKVCTAEPFILRTLAKIIIPRLFCRISILRTNDINMNGGDTSFSIL